MNDSTGVSTCIVVAASVLVAIAVLLLACCTCFAQQNSATAAFPAPKQLFSVRDGMRLADLQTLRVTLSHDSDLTKAEDRPPDYEPSQFAELNVSSVDLGSLGRGFVVYFNRSGSCGATANCPMALYIRGKSGYRPAFHFGGWGAWIVPSSGAVPDLISAWNMSCCDEIYMRYRYTKGRFVNNACAEGITDADATDPDKMSFKACQPGEPTFEPPDSTQLPVSNPVPTYQEMNRLRTVAENDLRSAGVPYAQLPVTELPHWLVVGVPAVPKMRVFVYPRLATGFGPAVLKNVPAEFVAESETEPPVDPSSPPPLFPIPALVIALRTGHAMTMRLYFEPGTDDRGIPANGRLVLQKCQEVTANSALWKMPLNPAELRVHASPCSGGGR